MQIVSLEISEPFWKTNNNKKKTQQNIVCWFFTLCNNLLPHYYTFMTLFHNFHKLPIAMPRISFFMARLVCTAQVASMLQNLFS